MADIGEKNYIAKEETSQQILTLIDTMANEEDIISIINQLETGVAGREEYSNLRIGTMTSGSTITATGNGKLYLIGFVDNDSPFVGATLIIDGVTCTSFTTQSMRSGIYTFDFSQSISFKPKATKGYYMVYLY